MTTKHDVDTVKRMLTKVRAKQASYFRKHHKLVTPYDNEFWALTQTIADLVAN